MLCHLGYFWKMVVTLTGLLLVSCMSMTILFSVKEPDRYIEIVKKVMTCIHSVFDVDYENGEEKEEEEEDEEEEEEDEEDEEDEDEQIIISDCKQYYTYKGVHYDIAFPLFWVLYEKPERGPHNCENCSKYGSLRGVFIMYCINCANEYNSEGTHVGYGAIDTCVEPVGDDIDKCAWRTYMKDRDVHCIGIPEEKEKAELEREGYEYVISEEYDEDGNVIRLYPKFIEIVEEYDDDDDYIIKIQTQIQ